VVDMRDNGEIAYIVDLYRTHARGIAPRPPTFKRTKGAFGRPPFDVPSRQKAR
jgi:hypothetical protein